MNYQTANIMYEAERAILAMTLPDSQKNALLDYSLSNLFMARVQRVQEEGLTMSQAIEAVLIHALEE